jgi:ATP-dependent protease ClpP protease subunit
MRARECPHKSCDPDDPDGCGEEDECQGVSFKLQERSLYIRNYIGEDTIFKVKSSLDECAKGPKARLPVHVFINSSGGAAYAAFALYDLFKNAPFPVHTYCLAECYSAGLIVFLGGTVRLMYPNSYLVFHEATYHDFMEPTFQERDAKKHADHMKKINERLVGLYCANSTLNKETLVSYFYSEHMLFAEEAVAAGLATKIFQKKSRKKSS